MTDFSPAPALDVLLAAVLLGVIVSFGLVLDVRFLWRLKGRTNELLRNTQALGRRPWSGRDAAIILLLMCMLHSFLALLMAGAHRFRWLSDREITTVGLVVQTSILPLIGLAAAVMLMRERNVSWASAFGLRLADGARRFGQGLACYLASMPLVAAVSLLYFVLLNQLRYPVESQDAVRFLFDPAQPGWLRSYLVVIAVTVAPIGEEALFRGIILPLTVRHWGPGPGMALVSLLFAAVHFHVPSLVPLWTVAMCFSVGYAWRGSLLVPIVMHALFNGVSLAVLFLLRDAVLPPTLGM